MSTEMSIAMKPADDNNDRIEMTPAQKRAQRARNIALALVLVAFVLIVYIGTWAKLGANILNRPL
jgi:hypothetical protein